MKIVTIKRTHRLPDVTLGILDIDGIPLCQTCELPWKDNKTDISCVPPGEYLSNKILSAKRGYELFEMEGVANREHIQIHAGNSVYDILGCVLLGRAFGIVETKDHGDILGVQESKTIFNIFMAKLKNDTQIKVVIQNV